MPIAASNREIEVRFLEIDKPALVAKLRAAGAKDLGEELIQEIAFYDKALTWMREELKVLRLRKMHSKVYLTFKHHEEISKVGTKEIEIEVSDFDKARQLLEAIGLVAYRLVEKKRHTFHLASVVVDIDTWPTVPPLVELEGPSEQSIKDTAAKLGFDWSQAVFEPSIIYLETRYHIPIQQVRIFTFDKVELYS